MNNITEKYNAIKEIPVKHACWLRQELKQSSYRDEGKGFIVVAGSKKMAGERQSATGEMGLLQSNILLVLNNLS